MEHSILIVEDDDQVRDLLRRRLERCGYDVCEAAGGSEAINALRTVPFDLVVTEIIMPDVDGIQIIEFVRRECPETKAIAISAAGNELYLENARGLGAAYAFTKPFKLEELVSAVKESLTGRAE